MVVVTNGDKFIGRKGTPVSKVKDAEYFENENEANKFLARNSCYKKIGYRSEIWKDIEVVPEQEDDDSGYNDGKEEKVHFIVDNAESIVKSFLSLLKDSNDLYSYAFEQLNDVSREIDALLHILEFYNLSASDSCKIAKMIKERRIKRRYYKDLMSIKTYTQETPVDKNTTKIKQRVAGLSTRKYDAGVLPELFEELDKKYKK